MIQNEAALFIGAGQPAIFTTMAKTLSTIVNWHYVVSANEECRVTSAEGGLLGTASPGYPLEFEAAGKAVTLSSDSATMLASHCYKSAIYGKQAYCKYVPRLLDSGVVYDAGLLTAPMDWSGLQFREPDCMVKTCEIWFSVGESLPSITWPENVIWLSAPGNTVPDFSPGVDYRLAVRFEPSGRLIISVAYAFSI